MTQIVKIYKYPATVVKIVRVGVQGPPGPAGSGGGSSITPGPGFTIVGNELRFDIESLQRG